MPRFTLTIDCDNAAFEEQPAQELARILRDVAARIERGTDCGTVHDINGNTVGRFDMMD